MSVTGPLAVSNAVVTDPFCSRNALFHIILAELWFFLD
jgi:hypothetical protein